MMREGTWACLTASSCSQVAPSTLRDAIFKKSGDYSIQAIPQSGNVLLIPLSVAALSERSSVHALCSSGYSAS